MLKTTSLRFAYNDQRTFEFPDICLGENENLLIIGDSGVGKTTFLHLLAGLLNPISGVISLKGTKYQDLTPAWLDRFRGRNIGLVFQKPHFVRALSIHENLALVQYLSGLPKDPRRIASLLENLGISERRTARPYQLSQGEQQRAAIAMALVNSPQLILADEPTSSLDDKNCMMVSELLRQQASATGAQLVIITHDQRLKQQFSNTLSI